MRRREVELTLVLVGVAMLAWWSRPPTPREEMYSRLAEGIARYNWGYYTESLDELNWVLDHFPANQEAYVRRARTYQAMGWEKLAVADYRQALENGASPRLIARELAIAEMAGAELETAFEVALEAYRADPKCARFLGMLCNQLERWEAAETYLLQAEQQGEDVSYELYYARTRGQDRETYFERLREAVRQESVTRLESLLEKIE